MCRIFVFISLLVGLGPLGHAQSLRQVTEVVTELRDDALSPLLTAIEFDKSFLRDLRQIPLDRLSGYYAALGRPAESPIPASARIDQIHIQAYALMKTKLEAAVLQLLKGGILQKDKFELRIVGGSMQNFYFYLMAEQGAPYLKVRDLKIPIKWLFFSGDMDRDEMDPYLLRELSPSFKKHKQIVFVDTYLYGGTLNFLGNKALELAATQGSRSEVFAIGYSEFASTRELRPQEVKRDRRRGERAFRLHLLPNLGVALLKGAVSEARLFGGKFDSFLDDGTPTSDVFARFAEIWEKVSGQKPQTTAQQLLQSDPEDFIRPVALEALRRRLAALISLQQIQNSAINNCAAHLNRG